MSDPRPLTEAERRRRERERKRRYRQRLRDGVAMSMPLSIYEDAIDAAICRGDLLEEDLDDPRRRRAALEDLINHLLLKG